MRYEAIVTEFNCLTGANDDAVDDSLSPEKDPPEGATTHAQVSDHLASDGSSEASNRKRLRDEDSFSLPQIKFVNQIQT